MFTMITLALSLFSSSPMASSDVRAIPDCADGALTVQASGWLASDTNPHAVDYHAILADSRVAGVPDHVWHKADHEGKGIGVCRILDTGLHYFVR